MAELLTSACRFCVTSYLNKKIRAFFAMLSTHNTVDGSIVVETLNGRIHFGN